MGESDSGNSGPTPGGAQDEPPSKRVIVYDAVAAQLHRDTRWPPDNLERVMGGHYRYDEISLDTFLHSVARRLREHAPSLIFEPDDGMVRAGLEQTVAALMAAIVNRSRWAT